MKGKKVNMVGCAVKPKIEPSEQQARQAIEEIQQQIYSKKEASLNNGLRRVGFEISKEDLPQFFAERVFCVTKSTDRIERFYLDIGKETQRFISAIEVKFVAGKVSFTEYGEAGKEYDS